MILEVQAPFYPRLVSYNTMKRAQTTFNKVPFLGVQVSGYDTFFGQTRGKSLKITNPGFFFSILATNILQLIFLRQLSRAFYRSHKIETFQTRPFLAASVNCGPSNTYVVLLVSDFNPKLLQNAYTSGQNAKRIFALSFLIFSPISDSVFIYYF